MFTRKINLIGIVLFVAVWVVILAVPRTRLLLGKQFSQAYNLPLKNLLPSKAQIPALQKLAKERPDDARIQALLVQSNYSSENFVQSYKDRLVNFDDLIRRFPDEKWLILDRMRASLAGGFRSPKGSYSLDDKGKPSYFSNRKDWLSPAQRKQTIRIALLGESKDPNNSFYNWAEAICWYDLGQNEKALDAFRRGSLKTDYDDGTLQDTRNRLYVQQLIMPTLLEDHWLAMGAQLFPQFAIMRHASRIAVWQAAMQEKAGNHHKALEIYGAQMRLCQTMRKNCNFNFGIRAALAMQVNAWVGFARWQPGAPDDYFVGDPKGFDVALSDAAQRFANYAQKHGRADLATQAISTAKSITADPIYNNSPFYMYSILTQNSVKQMGLLKWSGMMLLKIALAAIVLWGILVVIIALSDKWIVAKKESSQITIKPLSSILCVLFVLVCVVAGTVIILTKASSNIGLFHLMMLPQLTDNLGDMINLLHSLQRWIPWVTFALLFICCLVLSIWKMRKSTFPWMYSLKMLRNSLALLIVICSLAYGATSFASLPIRNQANASLDRFVKVGEVNFLREKLEHNKVEYTEAE